MRASIFACLALFLAPSVMARADFAPVSRPSGFTTERWQATHQGHGQLGEKEVQARLEEGTSLYEVPRAMAGRLQTFLSIEPVPQKVFRLHLTAGAAGELQATYLLEPKALSGAFAFQEGFVSKPSLHQEYSITLAPLDGGAYRVICERKRDGSLLSEFILFPSR